MSRSGGGRYFVADFAGEEVEPEELEPDVLELDVLEPDVVEPEDDGAELLFSVFFDPDVAESVDLAPDVSLDPPSLPLVDDDSADDDFWPFASARESLR